MTKKYIVFVFTLVVVSSTFGQSTDWLRGDFKEKSKLEITKDSNLVLGNGIVSRTFSTAPNGATVDYTNLVSGESVIRSIRPEALVELDGTTFEVGGLTGQPIHNYLKSNWIKDMTANPGSFKYTGYEIGAIEKRFDWKKREEWLPKDVDWPPKGKTLTMSYRADDATIKTLIGDIDSDIHREILLEDRFTILSPDWQIQASGSSERSSFINEGKPGEIMAMTNTSVYAEQALSPVTKVIKCKIKPGTDITDSHGLGMTVVFPNKKVRLAFSGTYGLSFTDGKQKLNSKRVSYTPYYFRMELRGNELFSSVSTDNSAWEEIGKTDTGGEIPLKVLLGKTDIDGGNTDATNKGDRTRCNIEYFAVLGELKNKNLQEVANDFEYLKNIEVNVNYNIYDGLPLISKWITVTNHGDKIVELNSFTSELLAVVEPRNIISDKKNWVLPNITVTTDYAFGGRDEQEVSYRWTKDPLYLTQIDYRRENPCLLEVSPEYGVNKALLKGDKFESYRVWEIIHKNWDRERKSLELKKSMRTIAPWLTENPIFMHVRSAKSEPVKKAIDQCAEVGFEMVIMTFGSGFNIEDGSEKNMKRMKELADYAHSKGIALGGYSLLSSRSVGKDNNVVMPEGKKVRFGNAPCIGSNWGQNYMETLYNFYKETGSDILEHDGSYPGDVCASVDHPGHKGLQDSRWTQFVAVRDFYRWCRSKGIYLNVPDTYYLNGSSKSAMGYRESNWSLPRAEQEIVERQNIYDGTWDFLPSQGWMFVPLVQYKGGGEAATIEPLKENLPHYGQRFANLFGAGVQAIYRGPQLYDAPETKEVVKTWVDFYNEHEAILNADIIHVRRPDGKDYDAILHADPELEKKGLLMVYNPLEEEISKEIRVNLYYTGLSNSAMIAEQDGKPKKYKLEDYIVTIQVTIPARSQTWFIIK